MLGDSGMRPSQIARLRGVQTVFTAWWAVLAAVALPPLVKAVADADSFTALWQGLQAAAWPMVQAVLSAALAGGLAYVQRLASAQREQEERDAVFEAPARRVEAE